MNRYTIIYERKMAREGPDGVQVLEWITFPSTIMANSLAEALQKTCLDREGSNTRVISAHCNAFSEDWN